MTALTQEFVCGNAADDNGINRRRLISLLHSGSRGLIVGGLVKRKLLCDEDGWTVLVRFSRQSSFAANLADGVSAG